MDILIVIIIAVLCILAGVLIGRANPKKADKLAGIAKDIQEKVKVKSQK